MTTRTLDPYRVLFPIGLAFALWGAAVWLFAWAGLGAWPVPTHAELMIGGFFLAFSTGFLLTAVPRFTGTASVGRIELVLASAGPAVFALAEAGVFGTARRSVALAALTFSLALLVVAGARRLVRRQSNPPPGFSFAGVSIVAGTVASTLLLLTDRGCDLGIAARWAHLALFHGLVPGLVLGVGMRLVPAILGFGPPTAERLPRRGVMPLLALAFFASFAADAGGLAYVGPVFRAALGTSIGVRLWQVHRRPARTGAQARWLHVSALAFLAGPWIAAAFPAHAVHAQHLTFVAGLGLMTLLVATRVTLAHGGHDLALEASSKAIVATAVLALGAAVVRATAGFAPRTYLLHLAMAAVLWIAAVLTWAVVFLPRLARTNGSAH